MDSPHEAAALADPELVDVANQEWLMVSARSSHLSSSLRRYQLDWSHSRSWTDHSSMNSISEPKPASRPGLTIGETSWLLHQNAHRPPCSSQIGSENLRRSKELANHYPILYDNISFADSPISHLGQRLGPIDDVAASGRMSDGLSSFQQNDCEAPVAKFRIILASYVLLGITLAIYSRNALSMAAVGMVANNQINQQLVDVLSLSTTNGTSMLASQAKKSLDGSCPVDGLVSSSATDHRRVEELRAHITHKLANGTSSSLAAHELKLAFEDSIKRRIQTGDLVDWSPSEQGLIFAAGSVGNLLIAIPLTRAGEIYGPKWVIFAAALGATLQAALMPWISPMSVTLVIVFQIIFNGLTFGADCVAYTLFARWLAPTEMAFFVASLLLCYQLGTIVSSFVTARILSLGIRWCWSFYVPAILCGTWTFIWAIIGASEPSESWIISKGEMDFLSKNSKIALVSRDKDIGMKNPAQRSVSWLKLAKDPNIWAIIAVKFTLRWYFSVYNSLMPTYLSSVAHMSVETIGSVSILQSVISLLSGVLTGYLTRSVAHKRPFGLSLAAFRKTFQSIVNFGLGASLVIFMTFDCSQWVTVTTLTISGICLNFYVAAGLQLPLDLSPDYCGLITSISNTLALGQALGAPISGLVLNSGPRDRSLWRIVWAMAVILNVLSGLLFIILVDTKPRDYNKDDCRKSVKSKPVIMKSDYQRFDD